MGFLLPIAIVLVILAIVVKIAEPRIKGWAGESFVSQQLKHLDPAYYKILDDILLPSRGSLNSTQIDHVIVSNFGIFCIETKAYQGWIFGNANQEYWTQVIYHHKERFYNPLRQNYAHVKAIEELVMPRFPRAKIISFIAFPKAGKIQVSGTDSVGYARDVLRKIKSFSYSVLSDAERDEICEILTNANIQDKEARKMHNRGVGVLKEM